MEGRLGQAFELIRKAAAVRDLDAAFIAHVAEREQLRGTETEELLDRLAAAGIVSWSQTSGWIRSLSSIPSGGSTQKPPRGAQSPRRDRVAKRSAVRSGPTGRNTAPAPPPVFLEQAPPQDEVDRVFELICRVSSPATLDEAVVAGIAARHSLRPEEIERLKSRLRDVGFMARTLRAPGDPGSSTTTRRAVTQMLRRRSPATPPGHGPATRRQQSEALPTAPHRQVKPAAEEWSREKQPPADVPTGLSEISLRERFAAMNPQDAQAVVRRLRRSGAKIPDLAALLGVRQGRIRQFLAEPGLLPPGPIDSQAVARGWVNAGRNTAKAAALMGIHPATVRHHLLQAGAIAPRSWQNSPYESVVSLHRTHPRITLKEAAEELGLSVSAVNYHRRKARSLGDL